MLLLYCSACHPTVGSVCQSQSVTRKQRKKTRKKTASQTDLTHKKPPKANSYAVGLEGSKRSIFRSTIYSTGCVWIPSLPSSRIELVGFVFVSVLLPGVFDTREWGRRKSVENCLFLRVLSCSRVLGVCLHPAACCAQVHVFVAHFSASKVFVWRAGSPHPLHRRGFGVGTRGESPQRAQQQQRC